MMNEDRAQAKALLDSGRLQEAAETLLRIWRSETRDVGDALYLTKVLRKLGRSEEALEFAREGARMIERGTNLGTWKPDRIKPAIYGLAAWCVYDIEIRNHDHAGDLLDGTRRIRATLERVKGDLHAPLSPYVRSALKAAKALNLAGRFVDTMDLLGVLNPDLLNHEHAVMPDGKTGYSDRERWFLAMCKASEGNGGTEDVLRICERAGNDDSIDERTLLFLEYRKGCALIQGGRIPEAIDILHRLAAKKREWWVLTELAGARYAIGESKLAMKDALLGLLCSDLSKMTGSAVLKVGEWALIADAAELAGNCRTFVESVWKSEGWPIKSDMRVRLDALPAQSAAHIVSEAAKALRASLWRELDRVDPPLEGEILRLVGDGRAMFIQSRGHPDIYARTPRAGEWRIGKKVKFRIATSFDRKRNQFSKEAIHITAS